MSGLKGSSKESDSNACPFGREKSAGIESNNETHCFLLLKASTDDKKEINV